MEMRLEDDTAAHVTVPKKRRDVTVWDTQTAGLFLRKFASGRAMFGVSYSVNGTPRRIHIRDAGERGALAAARKEALDVRAKARLGQDLIAEREAAKAAAAAAAKRKVNTLGKVAVTYLEVKKKKLRPRSYTEVERHINKRWKPLHSRPIQDITRADIVDVLDRIVIDHGATEADRAKTSLTTLFAWAIDAGHVASTPFVHIKSRAGNGSRKRTLTPIELRQVWQACDAVDDEGQRRVNEGYATIIKLLILSGCRRDEIGSLPWIEVVEAGNMLRLEIPELRTKNGNPLIVHLCPQAIALLPPRPDPKDPDARMMVFGRRRAGTGYAGWGKSKAELDASIAELRRKEGIRQSMAPWVVHDIRRTFATLLRELEIADTHLVELLINHTSGTRGGVAGHYDKSERLAERIRALDSWGAWIEANVITNV
jgi:integrase